MQPKTYLRKFAARVVERSGICRATVEAVLPAIFDEIRYQLTESSYPCVPIDGFGTFAVINRPEHEYYYNHKNANRIVTVPARRQLKFTPTRNMKSEVEAGRFDSTRQSFTRHPDDPAIRKLNDMRYRKGSFYQREKGTTSKPIYKKKENEQQPLNNSPETL